MGFIGLYEMQSFVSLWVSGSFLLGYIVEDSIGRISPPHYEELTVSKSSNEEGDETTYGSGREKGTKHSVHRVCRPVLIRMASPFFKEMVASFFVQLLKGKIMLRSIAALLIFDISNFLTT